MRALARLGRTRKQIASRLWTAIFKRHCSSIGTGSEITGPCRLANEGVLEVGSRLSVISRPWNRVEFTVARAARLRIGDGVVVNQGVRIACSMDVSIGDRCLIGDESIILDQDYHPLGLRPVKPAPVRLEDDVWLASRVIVLKGVTIGKGSVVGAGSVVTRSIPPYSFAAGVPARLIKSLGSR
jgi:acetyltransferase-like isoleucine patch superfamily enzyme